MKHVLVVEDDKFLAKALAAKLEEVGYTVSVLNDGRDVLAFLQEEKPNLILMDLIMPKVNGFETLDHLKSNDKFKDIPVYILSVLGTNEDRKAAIELGAEEYFCKTETSIENLTKFIQKQIPLN